MCELNETKPKEHHIMKQKSVIETVTPICPRCAGFIPNDEIPGAYPGALSRADDETEVCSPCGGEEAMQDYSAWKSAGEPKHYVRGASKADWKRPDVARPLSFEKAS